MPFLRINSPGLLTTIQDRGRFRYQKWGVPAAGAMDEYALRVGNTLVGNDENEGCLEITLLGPTIEFLAPGVVAITGADMEARLNDYSCAPWQSFLVNRGDLLQLANAKNGCRAYLAVAGGFFVPNVMGSKSTYLRGGIGGLGGRALVAGDELEIKLQVRQYGLKVTAVPPEYRKEQTNPIAVRVVLGPQDDAFTRAGLATFLRSEYMVTHESDRMGCRLEGPGIRHKNKPDIISDGIAMGSIQVPGSGNPIVMMADRQTTGGYAKIATVITPDLWKLAQTRPGDSISFVEISPRQAYEEYIRYENLLSSLPEKLLKQ